MRHSRYSIHNPLHNYGKVADVRLQRDPVLLLHSLSTDELITLHNVLGGGLWLKEVRVVLSWRQIKDAEKVRRGVGAFSFDVISGRTR